MAMVMESFTYNALPVRVRFGAGTRRHVVEELSHLGRRRAMVLCTPGKTQLAEEIATLLGQHCIGVIAEAVMHTPVDVTERVMEQVKQSDADCTVAVGGGSTIGLGKAIALRADLPQIALPTTYAGSEMTAVVGQTENGIKTTLKDIRVLPASVIYDVEYTLGLPVPVSTTSAMNAIAHAIESLYAQEKNPISRMQCLEGISSLAAALPVIVGHPADLSARTQALYGAFLCSITLGTAGMALHHKLCHTLGGSFNMPHAETHTVILPHAAQFNASAVDGALDEVARILGSDTVGGGLWDLAKRLHAPLSLAQLGFNEADIEKAADIAVAKPYWNPRAFKREDILAILKAAYSGQRPFP